MADADRELFDLLDDLEAQATALAHGERLEEVADRSRSAYHEVTLASRLMASSGRTVRLDVRGLGPVSGRLARVGSGWCRVEFPGGTWVVRTDAVRRIAGASERSVPEVAWRVVDRLGHAAVLRRLADDGRVVQLHLDDGSSLEASVVRVGADFLEVRGAGGRVELVSTAALVAHREG